MNEGIEGIDYGMLCMKGGKAVCVLLPRRYSYQRPGPLSLFVKPASAVWLFSRGGALEG